MEADIPDSFSYPLTCLDDIPHMCVLAIKQLCNATRGQDIELRGDGGFVAITRSLQCCWDIATIVRDILMYSEARGMHMVWHVSVNNHYSLRQNYEIVVLQLVFLQDLRQPEKAIQDILSVLPFIQETTTKDVIEKLKTGWSLEKYSNSFVIYKWNGHPRYMDHSMNPLCRVLGSYLCLLELWNNTTTISEKTTMCELWAHELTISLLVKAEYLKKVSSIAKDLNLESYANLSHPIFSKNKILGQAGQ